MLDQNLNDLRDEIYYADKEVSRFHFGFNQIKKVIHKNPSTKKRNPFQRTWKKSENILKTCKTVEDEPAALLSRVSQSKGIKERVKVRKRVEEIK